MKLKVVFGILLKGTDEDWNRYSQNLELDQDFWDNIDREVESLILGKFEI